MRVYINWLMAPIVTLHAEIDQSNDEQMPIKVKDIPILRFEFFVYFNLLFVLVSSFLLRTGWFGLSLTIGILSSMLTFLYVFLYFKAKFSREERIHTNILGLQITSWLLDMLPLILIILSRIIK